MAERKFKVKCIAISLKKNKIARATEEVTESQLAGDPDMLIKGGYIVETKSSLKMVKDAKAKADAEAKAKETKKDK